MSKRILQTARISPEPVDPIPFHDGLNRILPGDGGVEQWLFDRYFPSQLDAVAVDSRSGDTIKSLGDIDPFDLEGCLPIRLDMQRPALTSKTVLRIGCGATLLQVFAVDTS